MADDRDARIAELEAELREARAELQRSNNERNTALEQQTATAEVLRVMAESPTDAQRVLDAVAERALRLCVATHASLFLVDGDQLRVVAAAAERGMWAPEPGQPGTVGYTLP